jgi:mxaJ protein
VSCTRRARGTLTANIVSGCSDLPANSRGQIVRNARKAEAGPRRELVLAAMLLLGLVWQGEAQEWELPVCADPNNLPYSHQRMEGFENRIAELLAQELGAKLTYVWLPQPRTTIRDALMTVGECDLLIGVSDGHEGFLTSLAYYRSTYVFVYREDSPFEVRTLDDPVLKELRIGVQMPGGAGVGPGTYALAQRGLIENQVGFVPDQSKPHPLAPVIEAVTEGEVDVAIVWGPVAGYFALQQPVVLELVPVSPEIEPPFLPMVFSIAMGVRQGDFALRDQVNRALARRWDEIQAILEEYGVPLLPLPKPLPSQERASRWPLPFVTTSAEYRPGPESVRRSFWR